MMNTLDHMDAELRAGALAERVRELETAHGAVRTLRHENGSVTVIMYDDDGEHANPRDDDFNVSTLVEESRDYGPIDQDHAGLGEARARWADGYVLPDSFDYLNYGRRTVKSRTAEDMMARYVAMFRPDIVHYEHDCSFSSSQSDYHQLWGYVTRDALAEAGYSSNPDRPVPGTLRMRARTMFDQEVDLFRQWASGEVYGAIHVTVGEPVVRFGEHGAYVETYDVDEEDCWGFLGYDNFAEIAEQFTDSPVIDG